MTEMF